MCTLCTFCSHLSLHSCTFNNNIIKSLPLSLSQCSPLTLQFQQRLWSPLFNLSFKTQGLRNRIMFLEWRVGKLWVQQETYIKSLKNSMYTDINNFWKRNKNNWNLSKENLSTIKSSPYLLTSEQCLSSCFTQTWTEYCLHIILLQSWVADFRWNNKTKFDLTRMGLDFIVI